MPKGASARKDFQSLGIHATGPRIPVIARLRIGRGSERGEDGAGRGSLSGSPDGGWRQIRFDPCSGYCVGTPEFRYGGWLSSGYMYCMVRL